MKPVVSIGNQDFKSIRESQCFYVDKTNFIKEWWENRDIITLITRCGDFKRKNSTLWFCI